MPTTEETRELQTLVRSRYWKWMRAYLEARREALFHEGATKTEDLWRREGALQEINRLLKAPHLVLEWYRHQQKAGKIEADGEAGVTASPHEPWFVD